MWLDQWVAYSLIPLAAWLLISGLDDLWITAVWLVGPRPSIAWPSPEELAGAPRRRIAILVPLWHEEAVIESMLEHNIAAISYDNYDIFAGVYPNDPATCHAVRSVAARHPRVHVASCSGPGPTSKADCLNAIYRAIQQFERRNGVRFSILVTHDAEDLIHPEALSVIDFLGQRYDMVQIPVLPLPTPVRRLVHGCYCDEFAEYQTKDIPVRQALGGFLPSNGVGAGFSRESLERIAAVRGGAIFEPECLTEDYENGFAVHRLGMPQVFVPLKLDGGEPTATREYFPLECSSAVRQRARWVTGIALQGWERHGWGRNWREAWWFWRDRKGLVGSLLAPFANLLFLYGLYGCLRSAATGAAWTLRQSTPAWLGAICGLTLAISFIQMAVRGGCAARIYGVGFALLLPVRAVVGNWINFAAAARAAILYGTARVRRRGMPWGKTDHVYPDGELLRRHKPNSERCPAEAPSTL